MDGLTHHCDIPNLSGGHKKHTHRFKFKYLSWILNMRFVVAINSEGHGNESAYKDDSNIWNYAMQQASEKNAKNMIKILSYHHKDCHKKALSQRRNLKFLGEIWNS